jgi:hypothetical protein
MSTQEEENAKFKAAQNEADDIYSNIIHGISEEDAKDINNIIQNGTEKERNELITGLYELFKNK